MKRLFKGLPMLSAACFFASSGQAADENLNLARRVMDEFAKCLINRSGFKLRPILLERVGSANEGRKWAPMMDPDCLSGTGSLSLNFKPHLIRGSIYEVLYRTEFGSGNRAEIATVAPLTYFYDEATDVGRSYALAMATGDCAVRYAPGEVRALVMSPVGSPVEAAAMQQVVPRLSACIPQGRSLELSKSVVRGMVAEPLYRLSRAAGGKRGA